jgi:hypothetical protein
MFLTWQLCVRILTVESELEFAIQPSTTIKQLFEQVFLVRLPR